jgi:hypothetical protein
MRKAVNTSERSVNFYEIMRRNILEDGHISVWLRDNLKSRLGIILLEESLVS